MQLMSEKHVNPYDANKVITMFKSKAEGKKAAEARHAKHDPAGQNMVFKAAEKGYLQVVNILLSKGFDPNTKNPLGATA